MVEEKIKNRNTRRNVRENLIRGLAKLAKQSSIIVLLAFSFLINGCGVKQKFSCEFYNKDTEIKTENMLETLDGFKEDCVENPQVQFYWSF